MRNDRKSWELVWCTRVRFAASYLLYADLKGVDAQRVMDWAGVDSLPAWVSERVNELTRIANELTERNGSPGETALSITGAARDRLAANSARLGLMEVLT